MTCACCCPCDCDAANFTGSKVTVTSDDCAAVLCQNASPSIDGDYYYSFQSPSCVYTFLGSAGDCTYTGELYGEPYVYDIQLEITVECIDGGPEWTVTVTVYNPVLTLYGEGLAVLCVVDGHLVGELDVTITGDGEACDVHLVFS